MTARSLTLRAQAASRDASPHAKRKASLRASIRALAVTNYRLGRSLERRRSTLPLKR